MALMTIKCPSCAVDGTISFLEKDYEGPYRCWKCHALFSIRIEDRKLVSSQPLSEEELQKQQEADSLKSKFRRSSSDDD